MRRHSDRVALTSTVAGFILIGPLAYRIVVGDPITWPFAVIGVLGGVLVNLQVIQAIRAWRRNGTPPEIPE